MSGWNLTEGELVDELLNDDEYWSLFNRAFSDVSKKTNTYKFGLIKSICDQIYDVFEAENGYFMSYEQIFSKFAENYWNLVLKYGIKQMNYNGKSKYSKIESLIMETAEENKIPFETPFMSIEEKQRRILTKKVVTHCKRNVIGALYADFDGKVYSFSLEEDGITIGKGAYIFIAKHKMEIEKINYYAWARFLEKVNDDGVLVRVLEKLELATPRRNDLSVYREVLYREFQENKCFYCGKKIDESAHVDHFIPWSFIKTDNLWNFVLTCPKCNSSKSNKLKEIDYVKRIDERNALLIENCNNNLLVKKEFKGYYDGLIDRLWTYAKMSGIRLEK